MHHQHDLGSQVPAASRRPWSSSRAPLERTWVIEFVTPARAVPTVEQAIERGQLPPGCDADALLTTFRAPLFYRMVTTGDPIDEALIESAARVALNAARAGLLSG